VLLTVVAAFQAAHTASMAVGIHQSGRDSTTIQAQDPGCFGDDYFIFSTCRLDTTLVNDDGGIFYCVRTGAVYQSDTGQCDGIRLNWRQPQGKTAEHHGAKQFRTKLLGSMMLCSLALGLTPVQADPIALTGVRLIDGTGADAIENATIVINEGRIQAAGAEDEVIIPETARILRLDGRTVTPGLVNAHGHAGGVRGLESGHYSEEN